MSESSAPEPIKTEGKDPLWFRFFNSKAGVTLISVVLGGMVGNILVAAWQEGAKERERQRILAQENLTAGMNQVERAFGQAGAMINAAEDLAVIVGEPTWVPDIYPPDRAERVSAKRQEIADRFNQTISTWQTEREQISLMITYLLGTDTSDPGVEWHKVQSAVDSYLTCVKACYNAAQLVTPDKEAPCACDDQRTEGWKALREFARGLPKAGALIGS